MSQTVNGGKGGDSIASGIVGSHGGNGTSSLSLSGAFTDRLDSQAYARGGIGGGVFTSDGTGGNGGNATSHASSINTAGGGAYALSDATGGSGGFSYGISGNQGNAMSTSAATSQTGFASATSNASGLQSIAQATSSGLAAASYANSTGASGYAQATSISSAPSSIGVTSSAMSSVGSTANVNTFTTSSSNYSNTNSSSGAESYSYAYSNQTNAQVDSFVAGQSNIIQTMQISQPASSQTLAMGSFGGQFADNGTPGVVHTGSATTQIDFNGLSFAGKEIYVGLFGGQLNGFADVSDIWSVNIQAVGGTFNHTWSSATDDFNQLFNDNAISLGIANIDWSSLLVSVDWDIDSPGDALSGNFVVTANVAAVPEPSSIIFGIVLVSCVAIAARKRMKAALV